MKTKLVICYRRLIIGRSECDKTYLMNCTLLQKQDPLFISTKSINHYPNIKAQTSDEIQPSEKHENNNVVSDDMLLSKQENNIDIESKHNNIDIYYNSQSCFYLPKNTIHYNSNKTFYVNKLYEISYCYFMI